MTDQTKAPWLEVVAHMWQHEETGRIGFVDRWQFENGFAVGNPRLRIIAHLVRLSSADKIIAGKDAEIEQLRAEVERMRKDLTDANNQCLLKDRKIDHITKAGEESDAVIERQAERIAELERDRKEDAVPPCSPDTFVEVLLKIDISRNDPADQAGPAKIFNWAIPPCNEGAPHRIVAWRKISQEEFALRYPRKEESK